MSDGAILICAQLGSGSTEIAGIVGTKLGFEVYNTDKLLKKLAVNSNVTFRELAEKSISGEVDMDDLLFSYALDIVNKGKVIFEGKSSFLVFLAPVTLRVFLTAPDYVRAKHIAEVRKISYDKALHEVRLSDQDREAFAQKISKINWQDLSLYDLAINTASLGYEKAAELIVSAYSSRR
jgi:cytidylate kinase